MPDLRYISMEGPDGHLVGFVRAEVFDEVTRLLLAGAAASADAAREGEVNYYSTGIHAQDRVVGAHKARLECITNAIDALGRLRSEWGFAIDQLPPDVNAAREALWEAYHAELARKPDLMPRADASGVTDREDASP